VNHAAFLFCALPLLAEVRITPSADKVAVEIDGKPFTAMYNDPKPYLHPLRTATGVIVTRAFPMEQVEGETRDHPHHRGLWFTHGDVNGVNFWMNELSYKSTNKGKIIELGKPKVKSGAKEGWIESSYEWLAPDGKKLLKETRRTTFYSHPVNRVIDFDIRLDALDTVKFADTKEGTFAIRLADVLSEKKTGTMTNAAGAQKMKNVWGKPSPWVDYTGQINGETVGIAILDHPSNPKHPTHWHSRDYGLFAANIFGEHDFYNDKSRDGSVTLAPGKSIRFRYRVVIHPGDTKAADVAKLFTEYSGKK
jgi:hypothetical protein